MEVSAGKCFEVIPLTVDHNLYDILRELMNWECETSLDLLYSRSDCEISLRLRFDKVTEQNVTSINIDAATE